MDAQERAALVNVGTNRQGAVMRDAAGQAMTDTTVTGPRGGLTRKGTVARERHLDNLLDELFPL